MLYLGSDLAPCRQPRKSSLSKIAICSTGVSYSHFMHAHASDDNVPQMNGHRLETATHEYQSEPPVTVMVNT